MCKLSVLLVRGMISGEVSDACVYSAANGAVKYVRDVAVAIWVERANLRGSVPLGGREPRVSKGGVSMVSGMIRDFNTA